MRALVTVCLSLLSWAVPSPGLSQAVYGTIVGTVRDASGGALSNTRVVITDPSRAVSFTATTNDSGHFSQRFLLGGRYQIRVESTGFRAHLQDVVVSVDQETLVDIQMQVGDLSETVEVAAGTPLLKTERSDVATTFDDSSGSDSNSEHDLSERRARPPVERRDGPAQASRSAGL